MPKVNWATKFEQPKPKIDWLLAVMLERMKSLNITQREIGEKVGISTQTVNKLFSSSPWEWPSALRVEISHALGITDDIMKDCYPGGR